MNQINKNHIAKLYEWAYNPTTSIAKLRSVLSFLRMTDLVYLMTVEDKSVSKIAWVEFGRRRNIVKFEYSLVQVGETIELNCKADAPHLSETIVLA